MKMSLHEYASKEAIIILIPENEVESAIIKFFGDKQKKCGFGCKIQDNGELHLETGKYFDK